VSWARWPRGGVIVCFLVAGFALLVAHAREPYTARVYDVGGHLSYIDRILENHRVPAADDCWECHQPAPYYALAAGALALAKVPSPTEHPEKGYVYPGARVLRALDVVLGFATLACWLLTIRLVLGGVYERVLASAFCTFWPTFALHACRISNDTLLYFFAALSLWQLVSWRKTGRASSLVAASVAAAFAANTKMNGVVVILVVLTSAILAAIRRRPGRPRWPRGGVLSLVSVAALVAAWALEVRYWKQGKISLNFHGMGDNHMVKNDWQDFVRVTFASFLQDPWVHVVGDDRGRDEFWNYLYRSSLFGEFGSGDAFTRVVAYVLVAVGACFVPFVVAGLVMAVARGWRRDDVGFREVVVTLLGFLAFQIILRDVYPWAPHNDFRFILPVLLPCAILAATALGAFRYRLTRRLPLVAALPAPLTAVFCAGSVWVLLGWK